MNEKLENISIVKG